MEEDDRISIRRRLPEPVLGVGELARPIPTDWWRHGRTELSPMTWSAGDDTSAPCLPLTFEGRIDRVNP